MKSQSLFRVFLLLLAAAVFLTLQPIASAHSGRTDSNGGHYDRSTGEYHYHHGYPAHDHINGECPYDFDDRTGWNSGSSGTKNEDPNRAEEDEKEEINKNNDKEPSKISVFIAYSIVIAIYAGIAFSVALFAYILIREFRNNRKNK